MRLLEGDEFVRGILEPAGLCLADVERSGRAGTSYRTLSVPAPVPSSATSPLRCAVATAPGDVFQSVCLHWRHAAMICLLRRVSDWRCIQWSGCML